MTIIANPIYDVVFKYLMEDNRVAKILLSALLQKEITSLEMRRQEYTDMSQSRISLFRIDFSATVRDGDGAERLILIELQKTWLTTETLRFRQYLGTQYLSKDNVCAGSGEGAGTGLPIVSIYILSHKLGDLTEPVVYVRRQYLDYDSNPIVEGVPDRFIESLTHDSIIVQIPYLRGRTRNRLERMLQVFDQEYCVEGDEHFLEINEDRLETNDEKLLLYRLVKAAAAPDVRRAMDVEDEILSEIEARDTTIMQQNRQIEQMDQQLEQKAQQLEQKDQQLEQKDQQLEQKDQQLEQKDQQLEQKDQQLEQQTQQLEQQTQQLEQQTQQLEQQTQQLEQQTQQLEQQTQQLEQQTQQLEQQTQQLEQQTQQLEQKDLQLEQKDLQLAQAVQQQRMLINLLQRQGLSYLEIARELNMEETEVKKLCDK